MAAYMDDYTNRRKTRIYVRSSDHEHPEKDDLIGQTQAIPIKRGLFDGLSVAQIIAGAAAAATSVALASKIGLAGSIIGAAVSSVVTVVSSQLYRRFLDASAQKLKTASNRMRSGYATDYADHADRASADDTEVIFSTANTRGARVAPSKIRAQAAAARTANQRKVIAFSIVIALVAVIACAVAILLGTEGAGLGEKTAPIIPTIAHEQPVDSGTSTTKGTENTANTTDTDDATDDTAANDKTSNTESTNQSTPSTGTENGNASDNTSTSGTGESTDGTTPDESAPSSGNDGTENDTAGSEGQGTSPSQPSTDGQTGTVQ